MATPAQQRERLVATLAGAHRYAPAVLTALGEVPREAFVSPPVRAEAYAERALPIGDGQTLLPPAMLAHVLTALDVGRNDRVLEIGTGSGYQSAVLTRMGCTVYTLEVRSALQAQARQTWHDIGVLGVQARVDDARTGWPEAAPFAGIVVTCAASRVPDALLEQLAEGGYLVMPVGPKDAVQQLERWQRRGAAYRQETLGPVRFLPWVSTRQLAQAAAKPG